jgi:hypothetical protein
MLQLVDYDIVLILYKSGSWLSLEILFVTGNKFNILSQCQLCKDVSLLLSKSNLNNCSIANFRLSKETQYRTCDHINIQKRKKLPFPKVY